MSPEATILAGPPVILCADDFGISAAVSAGIEDLALAGRLSAASCMVTFAEWPQLAVCLKRLRAKIAIGLHINLTVGAPMGPMPKLAPNGMLPGIGALMLVAGATPEIAAEVTRQIAHFMEHAGFAPDFIDGHQHAHVLPGVRGGVLAALRMEAPASRLLIRDPTDDLLSISQRRVAVAKAMQVMALATGFRKAALAAGLRTNRGFSGFSSFDLDAPYARELEAGFNPAGTMHVMMCHPGHMDAVLATRDTVTARREQEFSALMAAKGLSERLWRPDRTQPDLWRAFND